MDENNIVLKTNTLVTTADTDFKNRLRAGSLVNMLIQAAIKSAGELGFGFEMLKQNNLIWVLSRLTVEIYKPALWNDSIEVETWPKTIDRLLYIRDFTVRNQHGDVIAKATSAWLAIDIDSRRPKLINNANSGVFNQLSDKYALNYLPYKITDVAYQDSFFKYAAYFDIDLNNHVTATRYIDWMMDAFPIHFHEKNYPAQLSVNYIKETLFNDKVQINYSQYGSEYLFEGNNECAAICAFRGSIKFS